MLWLKTVFKALQHSIYKIKVRFIKQSVSYEAKMKFTKMHVTGNDFIVIDGINNAVPEDSEELSKELCDRHFGVGADGLVLIQKSDKADILTKTYKPNGSEPKMSMNAVFCAIKYCKDNGITEKNKLKVETKARVVDVSVTEEGISADIGEPILETKKIPATIDKERMVNEQIKLKDRIIRATCMSFGTPHCVIVVDKLSAYQVEEEGPLIEHHEEFPQGTNVEFVEILNEKEIKLRPWKRDIGETFGAGTGACAALVTGVLTEKTERKIKVHLKGGIVETEWREEDNHLILKAKPAYVFTGEIER